MDSIGPISTRDSNLGSLFARIKSDAVQRTSFVNSRPSNLYIQEEVLTPGTVIQPQRQEIFLEQPTVVVFADDSPHLNWSHPCHYLLYQREQSDQPKVKEVCAQLPPYLTDAPETYHVFIHPYKQSRSSP